MKMRYTLRPFSEEYVESATMLFVNNYEQARKETPLLPTRIEVEPEWISGHLGTLEGNPGTTIWNGKEMLGYMITCDYFTYKGQRTAWIREYAHASIACDKSKLYRLMYMTLGETWIKERAHIHLICHLSNDRVLRNTLWELGFGAIVVENVRGLSTVESTQSFTIINEKDISRLIDIETEHKLYYRESPIFILKDPKRRSVEAALKEHIDSSDQIFVCYDNDEPSAYLIVGKVRHSVEGFVFRDTNTAQIKSAFAKPEARGIGIGASLLNKAIEWAREGSYDQLFVEHETANYYGGTFWSKHFNPVVYASMRYIDAEI